jgi:phosphate transport system permease protein
MPEKRSWGREMAGSAYRIYVLVLLMVTFLLNGSWTTFQQQGLKFLTGSIWETGTENPTFQIFPMLYGSFLISVLGLIIAVPISIATAYFIEFMAGGKVSKIAVSIIDLLAALPSILIGMWGLLVLTPVATGWSELLTQHLGFIPLFAKCAVHLNLLMLLFRQLRGTNAVIYGVRHRLRGGATNFLPFQNFQL